MAVAAASPQALPARARALIAGVAAAGAVALVAHAVQLADEPASAWGAALAIAVAVAVADQFTLTLPHGGEAEHFALTDAVWIAAIVLAPPGAPTLGATAGVFAWQVARRVPPPKVAFNVGQVALALTAAELVWGLAAPAPGPDEPAAWGLAIAAGAAAFLVNESTVALVIALVRGAPFSRVVMGSLRVSVLQWLGNVAIGLLGVLAWYGHPAGLLLVAVPLGLLYLAYRDWVAGLVEREQMEDMANTAERIARDGDPSARLPMIAREGRLAQLTADLNRMLEQLDRALGRERHLLREAAHELHAPVRAIRSELNGTSGETTEAGQQNALSELDRVERVLEEMEAVATAGRPGAVRPAPVALGPFLAEVGEHARSVLNGRLSVVAVPHEATARIDARWTERALLNLLQNAAVHGRPGSLVELRAVPVAAGWSFEVADDGGGVPAGHEEAVFEPFYRLSPNGGRPGLGLALVRSVAEAHGGTVGVRNRPGMGVTFWLRVPA